ncbi:MAG: MauE/DoxX family redox-associated membrane protein [Phycisphaerales bacterium JB059]
MSRSSQVVRSASSGGADALLIRGVIAAMFMVAACVKVADPDAFGVVLWRLTGESISPGRAVVFGSLLAGVEFSMALGVLLDRQTRLWLIGTVALLLVFTGALIRLALMADPPSCGCMSIPHPGGSRVEQVAGIGRNIGLAWLAMIALARRGVERAPPPRVPHPVAGFTHVEVILVIVVIAVLLGIALPVFGRARLAG